MPSPPTTEGFLSLDLPAAGKPWQTWYTIYGDLNFTNKAKHRLPLVVLHGGPGGNHVYLKRYGERLAAAGGADSTAAASAVVLYDSVGCGKSTPLIEKRGDGSFLNISLHVYELDTLIHFLGIQDGFNLLGHSYGGTLAAWYAATKRPKGLHRLILQSSPASFDLWDEAQMDLRRQLPREMQDIIDRCEADDTTDSLEYGNVIAEFTRRHFSRMDPPHEDLLEAVAIMAGEPTVVETMYGTNKFQTLGTCRGLSTIDELHNINVPTLLLNGRYDTAQDKVLKPFFNRIPKVRWIQFAESAHVAHLDVEAERVIEAVAEFLRD